MRTLKLVSTAVRVARRNWRLTISLWLLQLGLALVAIQPVMRYLGTALSRHPEGDLFLQRFSLTLFGNLMQTDGPALLMIRPIIGAFALLALLGNVFSAGGALEVLLYPDRRALAMRFARGGGRHFWRFVRMGAVAIPTALLFGALLSAPLWIARGSLDFRAEGARFFLTIAGVGVALGGLLVPLLALDLARVRVARTDARRAVRIYFRTLQQLLRHPLRTVLFWLSLALPLCLFGAGLFIASMSFVAATLPLVVAALLLQQLGTVARAFYRVALWSGEIELEAAGAPRGPGIP